jgi:hypothetical protein
VRVVSRLIGCPPHVEIVDGGKPYRGCFAMSLVGILGCGGFLIGLAYVVSLIIKFAGW